jgi:hypothetical protein
MIAQPAELAKFWCAWIFLCRVTVVDWDPESEQMEFLQSELSECLDGVGDSRSPTCFSANVPDFLSPDTYTLGRLLIFLNTQMGREEEARNIWHLMSKENALTCNYWLDRIAWERYLPLTRMTEELTLGGLDIFEVVMICLNGVYPKSSMILSDFAMNTFYF